MDSEDAECDEDSQDAWRRFDEAVEALRCARCTGQAKAPGPDLLGSLESLAAPFRGSCHVLITSTAGTAVLEFDCDVSQSTTELYHQVAAASDVPIDKLGLMMLTKDVALPKDSSQVLSYGFRAGSSVHLVMLISGILRPDHFWDFRGASADICDAYGAPVAHLRGGATCSQSGVSFDGREAYVEIDPWEWDGPVTFEVRVCYNSYAHQAAVLALGTQLADGRINDLFVLMSYTMFVVRESPLKFSRVIADQPISLGEWYHIVATSEAGSTALYINGCVVGNISEGSSAKGLLRSAFLGRSVTPGNFLDGTIAYVRIWHGKALPQSMVELLYQASLLES
ncbi:unnamed protein product [Symbiodinium natans]|uniref:Ubiquitin-like domain-containing protein n=1 Tax=Symbiodinium natans TaxID=878477 RepID=A0A812NQ64_9DINO|nr:unnamed protein product [Symbiodinium natans]